MRTYVSYRRQDSVDIAGRFSDRLAARFGTNSIFKDVDSIPFGDDFRTTVQREIQQCDVFLVLIGQQWLTVTDAKGNRRIENPNDFVRIEIESALQQRIPVVPVLIGGTHMPRAVDLPASLRDLAYRNAAILRPDPDFHVDMDYLIRALEGLVESSSGTPAHQGQVPELNVRASEPATIFVSHSTQDRKWVEQEIVRLLEDNNFNVWYSKSSIKTASQWEREILRGMESSDWFLLVVSPRAAGSEWVKDELNWSLYHRPTRIIPVIMEESNLWEFHIRLPRIQHIDFSRDSEYARRELLKMLNTSGPPNK